MNTRAFRWCRALCALGLCLVLSLLNGCGEKPLPPGVVATVNGQPITLRQVEAVYDTSPRPLVLAQSPSPELLQTQYGEALSVLVLRELVKQELERRGYTVSDSEVAAAEAEIRADYAPEDFEAALQEEYIDLDAWRELLRQRLEMERFQRRVLRPRIRISADEIRAAYEANPAQFHLPRKVDLVVYSENSKVQAEALRKAFVEGKIPDRKLEQTSLRLPFSRLPPVWQKDFANARPGAVSNLVEVEGVFQFARLEREIPQRRLKLVEAYPQVEAVVVERKIEPVFDLWLEEATREATVRVLPALMASPGTSSGANAGAGRGALPAVPASLPATASPAAAAPTK